MLRAILFTSMLSLCGCPGSIKPLYEQHRKEALATPPPLPDDWEPDASFTVHESLVDTLVTAALEGQKPLKKELQITALTITPEASVTNLKVSSKNCTDCLDVDTTLEGKVDWSLLGAKGRDVPFSVKANVILDVLIAQDGKEWAITLKPKDVKKVEVSLDKVDARVKKMAEGPIEDWLTEQLEGYLKPMEVGRFGAKGVPIRAARLAPMDRGIRVAMRTSSPTATPIELRPSKLDEGYQLDISADSLMDLARAASFEEGPDDDYSVVVEPNTLQFRGGTFSLGLRVWRLNGKGWWRDYQASGDYTLLRKKVKLEPKEVEELAQSEGAAFVDPLAALGEGVILGVISDTLTTALPTRSAADLGGKKAVTRLTGLYQTGDVISIQGVVKVK